MCVGICHPQILNRFGHVLKLLRHVVVYRVTYKSEL